jgi:Skp family chaperone for outer membrane proteins
MGAEFARRTNRKHEQENEPINSRQGKEREVLLHKILRVAHSVAQKAAKVAQNTPF